DFKILRAVMDINLEQKTKLIPRIKDYFSGDLSGKVFAVWGLAFKPYTDDIREAPALYNIQQLLEAGATVRAYDPEAMDNVKKIHGNTLYFAIDEYDALKEADALIIATEWPVFRTPDFEKMGELMGNKVIFDGRNLFSITEMKEKGFVYYSIGREIVK
ncbi:MAG: UDP-glucose 6-dehydrogenase, partial [Cyclobacteriaceae bacterium]|nr:UDP-glucose 6-dehydrogenase [Cyclobacteriaceae bacterium]